MKPAKQPQRHLKGAAMTDPCPKCGSPTVNEGRDHANDADWIACSRSGELVEDCPGERRKSDRRAEPQAEGREPDGYISDSTLLMLRSGRSGTIHPSNPRFDRDRNPVYTKRQRR